MHPDFSYRGGRAIAALTGYNGVLGYRTCDYWYNDSCDYYEPTESKEKHKREEISAARTRTLNRTRRPRRRLLTRSGAGLALGKPQLGTPRYRFHRLPWKPSTGIRICGTLKCADPRRNRYPDLPLRRRYRHWRGYAADNQKFLYLKSLGFDYFCNVDSTQYWIQIGERGDYFRMGRRNWTEPACGRPLNPTCRREAPRTACPTCSTPGRSLTGAGPHRWNDLPIVHKADLRGFMNFDVFHTCGGLRAKL